MIIEGDCLEVMKTFPDNHFSGIVTDPPYGLSFMGKGWDNEVPGIEYWKECLRISKPGVHLLAMGGTRTSHRLASAIEDAGWEIRDSILYWGYGQGFPKSHNFGCKCTGDPVPYNHEKDAESHSESSMRSLPETDIPSTFSTSSSENEVMFSRLQEQDLQSIRPMPIEGIETGEKSSLEGRNHIQKEQGELYRPQVCEMSPGVLSDGEERRVCDGTPLDNGEAFRANSSDNRSSSSQRSQHSEQSNRESGTIPEQSNSQDCGMGTCEKCGGLIAFKGFGTSLKPAYEPIIMAMKPLDGTFKQNAEKWGHAGINIDGCRIGTEGATKRSHQTEYPKNKNGNEDRSQHWARTGHEIRSVQKGRWPANVILDEEAANMLDEQSGVLKSGQPGSRRKNWSGYSTGLGTLEKETGFGDSGGASRFFYCSKASSSERNEGLHSLPDKKCQTGCGGAMPIDDKGKQRDRFQKIAKNNHPTVKPIALMQYLIKLVMPPKDGILLDPFAGSGSTIVAAKRLGIEAIGIEKQPEYCEIARKRIEAESLKPKQMDLFGIG